MQLVSFPGGLGQLYRIVGSRVGMTKQSEFEVGSS